MANPTWQTFNRSGYKTGDMITCIREIRLARRLTLQDVAARCVPPTTAQTIGRLETGTRTVSLAWLNRIADALGVTAADLVRVPDHADVPVAALVGPGGARAPERAMTAHPPQPEPGAVAVRIEGGLGDYRAGDMVWCERIGPDRFAGALNRDVLAPRPAGRFAFGRLIAADPGRLLLLPLVGGARQLVLADAPWLAVARRIVRDL
jgi:transcriptional regulator with XRE-family HTH domain